MGRAAMADMNTEKTQETEQKSAPPVDEGKKPVGDNRGLGDADGNRTGGDSKSPGATDPKDDPGDAARN